MARGKPVGEPWATPMIARGFVEPRSKNPSILALAAEAGLGPTTVQRIIRREAIPSIDTQGKLAKALGIDVETLAEWVDLKARAAVRPHWTPPRAIASLTDENLLKVEAYINKLALEQIQGQVSASKG
ncbi:helix-turn-helix domain-containing protein [Nocardia fluminea]|uniref:helix-turn-helix domain-containing protein n=1 Tax=Nocardia fluminea TaxID=134984 RepID=UPI0036612089